MEKFETQIKLILVIFGEYFPLDELTELIKVTPTQSWTKGDKILLHQGLIRKNSKNRVRQETVWEFSTGFIKTLDSEDVFLQFEKKFKNKLSVLSQYICKNKLKAVIDIVVEIADEEKPSVHFNKQIIKMCDKLGAEIDIDLYQLRNY
ncbi:MAG: DUF4279 domain-containing protein [Bacteroidota bacterium]